MRCRPATKDDPEVGVGVRFESLNQQKVLRNKEHQAIKDAKNKYGVWEVNALVWPDNFPLFTCSYNLGYL